MFKAMILSTVFTGVAASGLLNTSYHQRRTSVTPAVQCQQLTDVGVSEFMRVSRMLAGAPYASELRTQLQLASWPEDSVHIVTDPALCARLDSLIVAWLDGPGAGTLAGVASTVGVVMVARIGPTMFPVRAGTSVPPQPVPRYSNFVVATSAPTRVAYWGQN